MPLGPSPRPPGTPSELAWYCLSPEEHNVSWALNTSDNDTYYLQVYQALSQDGSTPTAYYLQRDALPVTTTSYRATFGCVRGVSSGGSPYNFRYKVQLRRRSNNALVTEIETPVRSVARETCVC